MKKLVLVALTAVATMMADPIPQQPCPSTTLADLVAGGSCLIGDKLFNNFTFSQPDGGTINTAQVSVSFDNVGQEYYLIFGGAGTAITTGFTIGWTVSVQDPIMRISVVKDQAFFSANATGHTVDFTLQADGGPIQAGTATTSNGNVNFLGQWASVIVNTAKFNPSGPGSLRSIEQTIAQTPIPEPMTFVLSGAGLLALGLIRRRQNKA
jgi:hypothetical protein